MKPCKVCNGEGGYCNSCGGSGVVSISRYYDYLRFKMGKSGAFRSVLFSFLAIPLVLINLGWVAYVCYLLIVTTLILMIYDRRIRL